jgi:hypothetical protein
MDFVPQLILSRSKRPGKTGPIGKSGLQQTRPQSLKLLQATGHALFPPKVGDRPMGVSKPQYAQKPDQQDLAQDRKAVNKEGNQAASNGCFD